MFILERAMKNDAPKLAEIQKARPHHLYTFFCYSIFKVVSMILVSKGKEKVEYT